MVADALLWVTAYKTHLLYSPVPRALQSAGLYSAVLEKANILVEDCGSSKGLMPAGGLGAQIGKGLPAYGPDGTCIKAWRDLSEDTLVELGLESYSNVGLRVMTTIGALPLLTMTVVIVFHGGPIETVTGIDYVPSGGVVRVNSSGVSVFDPMAAIDEGFVQVA